MAAGQLGGQLYPTHEMKGTDREKKTNHSFGEAIDKWNRHEYKKAVKLFKKHVEEYPDSQWASEAVLHIGCDAQYNGRYTEAEESFKWILEKNKDRDHDGATRLKNKAKLRLGILKVYQNNFSAAKELFRDLKKDRSDWRNRTYAAHWLQRLSRYKSNELAMLNCGTQALAYLLERDGKHAEARKTLELLPKTVQGHSISSLSEIASQYGYDLAALKVSLADLQDLPRPAIMHITAKNPSDSGHYWILEKIDGETLELFDPQSGRRFQQSIDEFSREWSGNALVFPKTENLPGTPISEGEKGQLFGGCCGTPRAEDDLGCPEGNCEPCLGAPGWKVNMINMNLFVADTPLWYRNPIGPSVEITLSYNSQSSIAYHEPFGNKWQFNYASYLVVDTGGVVTLFMPDGRRDVYSPDGSGGYTRPYKVYNILSRIAENHFELKFPDDTIYVYNIPPGTTSLQPFLAEIQDAHGQKLTFSYNSDLLLTTITDSMSRVTTVTYNSNGLATRVTDPFGRSAQFEYDSQRNLTKITDMGGYWSSFSYDNDIYISGIENERGRWVFSIEPADGIPNGSIGYPAPGQLMWENYRVTVTNPLGRKAEYHYDGNRVVGWYVSARHYIKYEDSVTNNSVDDVPKTKFKYTSIVSQQRERSELKSLYLPEGGYMQYAYDPSGNRAGVVDFHEHASGYNYDNNGNIIAITDAKGIVTTNVYGANGVDLLQIQNGLGTITMNYNGTHKVTSITDRLNNKTDFSYNSYGQITSQTDPMGIVTNYGYSDSTHQLQQVTRAGMVVSSFTYDSIGRVRTRTDSAGLSLTYEYDNLDRVTKISYPDGKFETYVYSSCCPRILDSVTDRSGRTTLYAYDTVGRRTKIIYPGGESTRYEYDPNGNVIRLVDANGNVTSFEYDKEDRLTKKSSVDGKFISFAYDETGLRISKTNARGTKANYSYDENHNLLGISYSDGTAGVSYVYDNYNRVTRRQDAVGTYIYSYDAENKNISIDGPWTSDSITYSYDAIGRLTGISPQGGQAIAYIHDHVNRLTGIQFGTSMYSYTYSGASPLAQSLTRPNGSITEYAYDGLNRMTGTSNKNSSAQILNQYVFAYNQQDVRSTETIINGIPITSFQNELITYDYNSVNQLLSSTNPSRSYVYDSDGNLIRGYNREGYVMNMTYDAENRLTSSQYTDNNAVVHRTEYLYGGDNFIASMKKYENGALLHDIRYVRAGFLPLQERDGNNQVVRNYTWGADMGGGIGGLLNLNQSGLDYSYLYDGKGNVTALIDSSQNVVAAYAYDPFGVLMSTTGSLIQPYQFSTKEYDPDTGLLYYGYRFYAPVLGRWITRDPLGEQGGINLYGFVGNNSINRRDPFGLSEDIALYSPFKLSWRTPWGIYFEARQDTKSRFPLKERHNRRGDAYRHCLASCMLTRETTELTAEALGWANEKKGDWFANQECGEKAMDMFNNAVGRDFGNSAQSTDNCINSCLSAGKNGLLINYYESGSTEGYGDLHFIPINSGDLLN